MYAFVKPQEKVLRLAEQQIESFVLEGQPELVIYYLT